MQLLVVIGLSVLLLALTLLAWRTWDRWHGAGGADRQAPTEIHLLEVSNPRWKNADGVDRAVAHLQAAGFLSIGTFSVPEMQGMYWWPFQRIEDGLLAIISEHELTGCAQELRIIYANGSSLTICNQPNVLAAEALAGHETIHRRDTPLKELLRIATKRLDPALEVLRFDKHRLVEHITARHALAVSARGSRGRGGLGRRQDTGEVRGGWILGWQGRDKITAGLDEETQVLVGETALGPLHRHALARLLNQRRISVAWYEDWRERLLVVLDGEARGVLLERIERLTRLDPEQRAALEQLPEVTLEVRPQLRQRLEQVLPRSRHLGEVQLRDGRITADVYLLTEIPAP